MRKKREMIGVQPKRCLSAAIRMVLSIAILTCLSCGILTASPEGPTHPRRFFTLPASAPLSSPSVLSVECDRKGFLWIGTQDGLNRFDGISVKHYRGKTRLGQSISYINHIQEDPEGFLWLTSHEGLIRFDPVREVFEDLFSEARLLNINKGTMVICVAFVDDGTLWAGTYNGIIHWNRQSGAFRHYVSDPETPGSIPLGHERISCIHPLDGGRYLLVASFSGLMRFDTRSGRFELMKPSDFGLELEEWSRIYQMIRSKDGTLWAATLLHGVIAIDPSTPGAHAFNASGIARELRSDAVYGIVEDGNGALWLSTDNGLVWVSPERDRLVRHKRRSSDPHSMGSDSVNNVGILAHDYLWLPTRQSGLWFTDMRPGHFSAFSAQAEGTLSYPAVYGFCEDREGRLLVVTDGGGLNRVNRENGKFEHFRKGDAPFHLPTDKTLNVCIDRKGRYWIGTWNEGLIRYDPSNGERRIFLPDDSDPGSLSGRSVFDVIETREGSIWVATWNAGICRYDEGEDRFVRVQQLTGARHAMVESPITTLMEDREGWLWIGSEVDGVCRMNPKSGESRVFRFQEGASALKSNSINCFWEDPDGLVYVGTNGGGLCVYDPKQSIFVDTELASRLHAASVLGIQGDDQGRIWLASNAGLYRWDPQNADLRHYTEIDGLHDDLFARWSHARLSDGTLAFGGPNGFTLVDPSVQIPEDALPVPVITAIALDGSALGSADALTQPSKEEGVPRFPFHFERLRFEFTAPSFRNAERLRFRYRIAELDQEWQVSGTSRAAEFNHLPHGMHTFEVEVSDAQGGWHGSIARFVFRVETPWYALWYHQLLMLLSVLGAFGWIMRLRSIRDRKAKEMLEARIRERTDHLNQSNRLLHEKQLEVEARNEQLYRINQTQDRMLSIFAHDIKNPFAALLSLGDRMHTQLERLSLAELRRGVDFIHTSSHRIYELLENLLYWQLTKEHRIPCRLQEMKLTDAVLPALQLYREIAAQQSVHMQCDPDLFSHPVMGDPSLLTMLFRNLLNNAIKYSPQGGHIEVSCTIEDGWLVAGVQDEGPGLNEARAAQLLASANTLDPKTQADAGSGTGLGLPLCVEIAQLHQGRLEWDSNYRRGCRILIYLPLIHRSPLA
jgi:ligand-binding sensor domain-containing protein/signal transduction histidine kinase